MKMKMMIMNMITSISTGTERTVGRFSSSSYIWSSQTVKTDTKVMRSTGLSKMVGFVLPEGQAAGK